MTGWSVLVAPGVDGTSMGTVYLDDGESIKPNATKVVSLSARGLQLNVTVMGQYEGLDTVLGNVMFLGVRQKPKSLQAMLNGMSVGNATYNGTSESVFVGGMDGMLAQKAWSGDWTLSVG